MTFFDSQLMFICEQVTLKIIDVNEAGINRLGYSRKELLGRPITFLGKVVDLDAIKVSDDIPRVETWIVYTKDKEELLVQFSSHLINYKGRPCKVVVAHEVNGSAKKSLTGKRPVSSPIGFRDFPLAEIEWNKEGRIIRWSNRSEELFGYTHIDIESNPYLMDQIIGSETISEMLDQTVRETEAENSERLLIQCTTKHGNVVECEWYNSYLKNEDDEIESIYSVIKDVTEQKKSHQKVLQMMKSFRDLYNSISDAIYLVGQDGVIIDSNEGIRSTFGYEIEEVIGKKIKFLSASGKFSEDKMNEYLNRAMDGENINYEGWGKKKNGEVFPSEVLINKGTYSDEDVLIIVERDISDRLLSHEILKQRESMFSNLFHASPIGIALLDHHSEIENINKSFEEIFGYTEEEVKGLELDKLIVPDSEYKDAMDLSQSKVSKVYTGKRKTKSGALIDVIVCAVPVIVDGRIIAMYGIYVDITDRRQAEETLRKNLREKEVLLAEIHHRVKNNLAVITSLLELQALNSSDTDSHKVLRDSQMRVNSIALVHELLYQSEDFSQIEIKEYILDLTRIISNSMERPAISVEIEFDIDIVELDITQAIPCGLILNEVLTNSYKHAFEGLEKGKIKITFKEKEGGLLVYSIEDNGVGLPEEDLSSDEKKSLGMTLVKTLGKQLKAQTNISSDKGARFEFIFTKKDLGAIKVSD